jgi:outer membrane lipoprotein-sorting protein
MKKILWLIMSVVVASLLLTACGEKTQEDVISDLERNLDELTGYKTKASMTLQTGEEPQVYDVEVWFKSPSFYRVALNHTEKDQSQIILRNEEGVFVLTPALNKSFRFQSDWPENNSQVYLYESLMNDILMDPERAFTATEDHYTFQTNTNYTNKNLNQQEVRLNKKDLTPASVKVMDAELSILVEVAFEDFQLNAEFSEGDFEMDRNMTGAQLETEVPAMTDEDEADEEFAVFYPMYEPQGTTLSKSEEVETDNGLRVVLTYDGDQPFTLIQQQSQVVEASTSIDLAVGEPVDLGFTFGVLTGDEESNTISWSFEGTDFFLASDAMDKDELMSVARSVYGTHEK